MIDPHELRIGNLFLTQYGEYIGVGGVIDQEMELAGWNNQCVVIGFNGDFFKKDEIFGIPLTEEWLKKLGLIKQESGHYKHSGMILFSPIEKTVSLEYTHDSFYFMVCISQIINHVHQLQNLYHSLTGTELTINQSQTT